MAERRHNLAPAVRPADPTTHASKFDPTIWPLGFNLVQAGDLATGLTTHSAELDLSHNHVVPIGGNAGAHSTSFPN